MKETAAGELFTQLTLEVFKLSGMLSNDGDQLTKEFGITSSRWKILGALDISPTPLTVSEIGRAMGQSRQAVQRLVDVMVKDDLLHLVDNPNHKRAKLIELAPKGSEVCQQLYQKWIPEAERHAQALSAEELKVTLAVIQKIAISLGDKK
ncbi:MarR family transcriptional regulator [Aestuariirhabdus sp. Z084]|uniref:MarR family winged helix-turn-helix transcriptional regulator n=1 Tax=Aestuariirhabdus haliotis TaxID=2918751 RepID=UPI00201B446A|nr:MarR family transcriptional regulator [Aestuariirhabdus haliotis]MCL6417699.1 MarR family transcriptional regulator [Aestuariirhabdus haliotis]MCL6421644.1 MarR family transcriptional regulator [Aestuariirhabdus haliotis]